MQGATSYSKQENEVIEALNARYPVTIGEGGAQSWKTPFGVTFADPFYLGDTLCASVRNWVFFYDAEGSSLMGIEGSHFAPLDVKQFKGGFLNTFNILEDILPHLDTKEKGYKVYDKSLAIKKIELVLGVEARLHYMHFGAWQILLMNFMSCVSNPFGMGAVLFALGGVEEDSFEVRVFKDENGRPSTTNEMHIDKLLALLESKNLNPLTTICRGCGIVSPRKSFLVCSRCKKAYFCDEVCQKFDWKEHNHKAVCK